MKRICYCLILSFFISAGIGIFIDLKLFQYWIFTAPSIFSIIYPALLVLAATEQEKKRVFNIFDSNMIFGWIFPKIFWGSAAVLFAFLVLYIFNKNTLASADSKYSEKFKFHIIIQTIIPIINLIANIFYARLILSRERKTFPAALRFLIFLIFVRILIFSALLNLEVIWGLFKLLSGATLLSINNKRKEMGLEPLWFFEMFLELFSFLRKCLNDKNCEIGFRFVSIKNKTRLLIILQAALPLSIYAAHYFDKPKIILYHTGILAAYFLLFVYYKIYILFASKTNSNLLKELYLAPVNISDFFGSIYIYYAKKTFWLSAGVMIICIFSAIVIPLKSELALYTIVFAGLFTFSLMFFAALVLPDVIYAFLRKRNVLTAFISSFRIPFLLVGLGVAFTYIMNMSTDNNAPQVLFGFAVLFTTPFYLFYNSILQLNKVFELYVANK